MTNRRAEEWTLADLSSLRLKLHAHRLVCRTCHEADGCGDYCSKGDEIATTIDHVQAELIDRKVIQ